MSNGTLARRPEAGAPGDLTAIRQAVTRLASLFPESFTPDRMLQLLNVVVSRTPDLMKCPADTIVAAAATAVSLDLSLTPGMGEAYLIPRWNKAGGFLEAMFEPGFKGLEKLACRTGTALWIQPREVCEADEFAVEHVNGETHVHHKLALRAADRGPITHVYAVAEMFNGKAMVEIMTAADVEKIRAKSQMPNAGPWKEQWKEMACKTVVKRLCKRLPRSSDPAKAKAFDDLHAAIAADNRQYDAPAIEPPRPDNASGYAKGQYASPEQTEDYLRSVRAWIASANASWADLWQGRGATPEVLGANKEVLNVHQVDNHLLKWAVETGRLDAAIVPEEAKVRQLGRYVAILAHRSEADKAALVAEMEEYGQKQWDRRLEAVARKHPELIPVEDRDQADPPDDLPEGY